MKIKTGVSTTHVAPIVVEKWLKLSKRVSVHCPVCDRRLQLNDGYMLTADHDGMSVEVICTTCPNEPRYRAHLSSTIS